MGDRFSAVRAAVGPSDAAGSGFTACPGDDEHTIVWRITSGTVSRGASIDSSLEMVALSFSTRRTGMISQTFTYVQPVGLLKRRALRSRGRGESLAGGYRECVAAIVLFVRCVSLDPDPLDGMKLCKPEEFLPEILVENRLPGGCLPTVFLPLREPALDEGVVNVLGVGVEDDLAGHLQSLECPDRAREFHAVVGGVGFSAREFAGDVVSG